VDESLIANTNEYLNSANSMPPLKDGIKNMIPGIKTKMEALHLGYDDKVFFRKETIGKERIIMSAGLIPNDYEVKRKGFDVLIEAAKEMKDVKFVLIGLYPDYINKFTNLNLPNLELHGVISYSELINKYSMAKVFAQISLFEGLPSTICEAMLCECIPVGSNVNAIPKIINGTGYVVQKRNIHEIIEKLTAAVNSPEEMGIKAREHIIKIFPFSQREKKIVEIIKQL
jgi:glycosyltransferase involved in cell wall biosynthesis